LKDDCFWKGQHSPAEEKLNNWMNQCWDDRFK